MGQWHMCMTDGNMCPDSGKMCIVMILMRTVMNINVWVMGTCVWGDWEYVNETQPRHHNIEAFGNSINISRSTISQVSTYILYSL